MYVSIENNTVIRRIKGGSQEKNPLSKEKTNRLGEIKFQPLNIKILIS